MLPALKAPSRIEGTGELIRPDPIITGQARTIHGHQAHAADPQPLEHGPDGLLAPGAVWVKAKLESRGKQELIGNRVARLEQDWRKERQDRGLEPGHHRPATRAPLLPKARTYRHSPLPQAGDNCCSK